MTYLFLEATRLIFCLKSYEISRFLSCVECHDFEVIPSLTTSMRIYKLKKKHKLDKVLQLLLTESWTL